MDARHKPLVTLLEKVKFYIMQRMTAKRKGVKKWHGDISPKVLKILQNNKWDSRYCTTM